VGVVLLLRLHRRWVVVLVGVGRRLDLHAAVTSLWASTAAMNIQRNATCERSDCPNLTSPSHQQSLLGRIHVLFTSMLQNSSSTAYIARLS
jgi:hypothetical protein